jgi:hypothetical protein
MTTDATQADAIRRELTVSTARRVSSRLLRRRVSFASRPMCPDGLSSCRRLLRATNGPPRSAVPPAHLRSGKLPGALRRIDADRFGCVRAEQPVVGFAACQHDRGHANAGEFLPGRRRKKTPGPQSIIPRSILECGGPGSSRAFTASLGFCRGRPRATPPVFAPARCTQVGKRMPQSQGCDLPAIPSITGRRGRRPWAGPPLGCKSRS